MKYLSPHITALILTAATAFLSSSVLPADAQEIIMPDRWEKALNDVPAIFSRDTVTIRVLGDVMMHQNQIDIARDGDTYDFSSYFSLIEDDIREADIAVANMEFTLAGEPYSGYPCFSAPDVFAGYLADCGFDVFLAANNHIFDKGTVGAERTIRRYRELSTSKGIRFTGIASDEEDFDATTPLMVRSKGIRLAMLNATYGTNTGLTTHWPKTIRLSSEDIVSEALAKAREADADVIIAFPHWGTEYVLTHSHKQEETAVWLAKNGADIIIGAHPHVIQDFQIIEVCRNGSIESVPIAYSLGNAVSNMSAPNTQLELMATIRIIRDTDGDIRMLPVEFTYLWCSRPGGFNDSYTVIPVEEYLGRKDDWKNGRDYDKMTATYRHVTETTGIIDKHTSADE